MVAARSHEEVAGMARRVLANVSTCNVLILHPITQQIVDDMQYTEKPFNHKFIQ